MKTLPTSDDKRISTYFLLWGDKVVFKTEVLLYQKLKFVVRLTTTSYQKEKGRDIQNQNCNWTNICKSENVKCKIVCIWENDYRKNVTICQEEYEFGDCVPSLNF